MRAILTSLALLPAAAVLSACGSSSATPSPTPTPLPPGQLQQRYLSAANAYNAAEKPIAASENSYCVPQSASADLNKCVTALSNDRQVTITFDNAVRTISFPDSARADVTKLLGDDAQLEMLLLQASTAPSLTAIDALTPQIFRLLTTSSTDADKVRTDIGVPTPSAAVSPSGASS
ncbi:MAG: hypothetical protein ABR498_01325 [Candidatus Dormibacteria bacterium]